MYDTRKSIPDISRRYADVMEFDIEGEIFRWAPRREDWYFAALPTEISELIREVPRAPRGFGSVRVEARVGTTTWRTSIFPDAERGTYVLPLKRAVRDAEGIAGDGTIRVRIRLLDL